MSAVKIEFVDLEAGGGPEIGIAGLDLLDGTPVLDVKPYIPYADQVTDAQSGWAEELVKKYPVEISEEAEKNLSEIATEHPDFRELMIQVLEIDPRPAYQKREFPIEGTEAQGMFYGLEIMGFEVKYRVENFCLRVLQVYRTEI